MRITRTPRQLVINYVYDQAAMSGPPFSVTNAELAEHYGTDYKMTLLYTCDVEGGLKGRCPATECVWLLEQN